MRAFFVVVSAVVVAGAGAVRAQTVAPVLNSMEVLVACSAPPSFDGPPENALRIVGVQDSLPRALFGTRDLLVISGGTTAGVQLGQEFFIRRSNRFGLKNGGYGRGAKTLGWLHIVAVNESTAIAALDHVCGGIVATDYLEPFVAPVIPPDIDRDETAGQPDFNALGHVVAGNEDRTTLGRGDFALIDQGSEHGVLPGAHFAVYRDVRVSGMPLASIGEIVVIATGPTMSLTRLTSARDAVYSGDYIAPRK